MNPCGETVVTEATPPTHVIDEMALVPVNNGVRSDNWVSSDRVPGDVIVPPCEINAPVFCSCDGDGAV